MTSLKDGVGVLLPLLLSLLLLAVSNSYASGSQTTPNLIDDTNWSGVVYGPDPGGCCASISGAGPLYDTLTDTIMFSYGNSLISQTIAINQALQASGIQVDGYNYRWTYRRIGNNASNPGNDGLVFTVEVRDSQGNIVETYQYNRSGIANDVWYTDSGTQTFANSYLDPQSIALKIRGQDGGFWGGYYGPEIKNIALSLNYSVNPCANDPLYDTSCPGYADAYAQYLYDQNCAGNPLYDSGCPGYTQAYYNQQCSINPLYDQGCPGYAQAYFDQQCSFDPLYNQSCSGYATAYYDQQCSLNPLYDTGCSGYAQAYLDQQCGFDPLYDTTCNGYQQAYYNQQCGLNPLYDSGCPGYASAYYDLQCSIDTLYDSGCPGYAKAYYDQQCSINALYDTGCPGYTQAYYDNQCSFNPLYDTGCNGYADAFFAQQCSIDSLYDTQCPGYASAYYDLQCSLDALYDSGCNGYDEAYATWQLDRVCSASPQADPRCPNYVAPSETTNNETQISSASEATNPIVDTEEIGKPSTTGDATVDSILKELADVSTTTVGMEMETLATVEVEPETTEREETETTSEADATEELIASVESETDSESTDDSESTEESDGSDDESSDESEGKDSDGGDSKSEKQDSKNEKMRKAIAAKAANLANDMSNMASLEAQQAVQAQVLALINYVPDFNTYSRIMNGGYLPDAVGYPDTQVPESRRGLRQGLAQQLLHDKMVEMQYENSNR